jgi:hypothetical protein
MQRAHQPAPSPNRAQAPIRWPQPDRAVLSLIALWAFGLVGALVFPALFVAPGARTAPAGRVWLAFGGTLVGAAVMLVAALGMFRRGRDASVLTLGVVPAVAVVSGGVILAVTKIYAIPGS